MLKFWTLQWPYSRRIQLRGRTAHAERSHLPFSKLPAQKHNECNNCPSEPSMNPPQSATCWTTERNMTKMRPWFTTTNEQGLQQSYKISQDVLGHIQAKCTSKISLEPFQMQYNWLRPPLVPEDQWPWDQCKLSPVNWTRIRIPPHHRDHI